MNQLLITGPYQQIETQTLTPKERLLSILNDGQNSILETTFLNNINGFETLNNLRDWHSFIIQRLVMATSFMALLQKAYELTLMEINKSDTARQNELKTLKFALENNITDETGRTAKGENIHRTETPQYTHIEQRQLFAAGFGLTEDQIDPEKIDTGKIGAGAMKYIYMIGEIKASQNPIIMAAALLFLEKQIPSEFRVLLKSLEGKFPEVFGPPDLMDSPEQREKKLRSRLYLEDHIEHDSKHYAELLKAILMILESSPQDLETITNTITALAKAKVAFYNEIGERASKNFIEHD